MDYSQVRHENDLGRMVVTMDAKSASEIWSNHCPNLVDVSIFMSITSFHQLLVGNILLIYGFY